MRNGLACRSCGTALEHVFVDLGMAPLANSYLRADALTRMEPFYPLTVLVCAECFLVQLPAFHTPEKIFSDYAYFSSYSDTWLRHANEYCHAMISRFGIGPDHNVVEIASNDGYLLRFFKQCGIRVLGVEPAANVAAVAIQQQIPTIVAFFGTLTAERMAQDGHAADLLVGNNVLAHVPDLNDFVAGLKLLLKPTGIITMEFPHLSSLMANGQFDTIYHEHFSYFSLSAVQRVLAAHDLSLFDVELLPTHGGSLRIYAQHAHVRAHHESVAVARLLEDELRAGIRDLSTYRRFSETAYKSKRELLRFLIAAKSDGKRVAAYGAPAKGNTLLNFCGVRTDMIDFTVDRSPHKQGLFLPGTHIPIFDPDHLRAAKPDYVVILPWNIRDEIIEQMRCVTEWGGRFVIPVPHVEVLS